MHQKKDGTIQNAVEKKLAKIVDPRSGLDVLRMGLIRDLHVQGGVVSLVFRATSRIRSMASRLAAEVYEAVRSVGGVQGVMIQVEDFDRKEGAARAGRR